jgi:murein DD-endopeptidase MepM/ murein hydrolase activator NlpD
MTLRMYLVVTVLLFPVLISAQTSSPATKPQSTKTVAASFSGGSYPTMSNQAKQRVQQLFEIFESGQTGVFWTALSEGAKKNYGSEEKFAATTKKLREHLGSETKMDDEIFAPSLVKPGTLYSRLSEFSEANQRGVTNIAINEQGQVEVFQMGPERTPSQGRYGGYKDVTKLMLPFAGQWFVFQGGRSAFQNGYFPIEDQRFSLDFALLKNGRPFSGEGSDDSDYYCFGQPVLAPADGLIVDVQDGYQDNPPGRPVADSPKGNLVLIAHGNSEFSLIDHLKQNSVKVKKGDKVKQGDAVAECGNSGPSAAPAVHFQLQNSAGLPLPDSLPAQFVDYVANGKPVAVGEPVRGQTVSNGPSARAGQSASTNQASKTPPSNK